jgi:hypothetical protein
MIEALGLPGPQRAPLANDPEAKRGLEGPPTPTCRLRDLTIAPSIGT